MKRMFILAALFAASIVSAEKLVLESGAFRYHFNRGRLERLEDAAGKRMVAAGGFSSAIQLSGKWQVADENETVGNTIAGRYHKGTFEGANLVSRYAVDPETGDVVLAQEAETPQPGLGGVRWCIGFVPPEWTVIAPQGGGLRYNRDSPEDRCGGSGPMGWEYPLIIYENPAGGGFYLYSDDLDWRFTSWEVKRSKRGFETEIITWNNRPFKDHRTIRSMTWKLNTFTGDWRDAAKRVRAVWQEKFRAAAPPQPAWAAGIDLVVIDSQMKPERIEALLRYRAIDPERTLVYLSHWRGYPFDRGFPDYDKLAPRTEEFIRFLKEKKFRVMLHANWFGIDRSHPLYETVKYALIRNPDGSVKSYRNPRQTPPIVIDYVNPAAPEWRAEFVGRMKRLVEQTGVDGLHLDQNQHCHNYDGGVIGGMSMIEGTLALHRELREALPQVALGSEGSNGLLARYVAFAQKSIWSLIPQQIDPVDFDRYHPVSNYLFSPGVTFYLWLGSSDPSLRGGQLFAAWRDGVSRCGVIPTIRTTFLTPPFEMVEHPTGFRALEYGELEFIGRNRMRPDYDGLWPRGVRMPWRSADGSVRAAMMTDGTFVAANGEVIGRTLLGASEMSGPGSIDGEYFYDARSIKGLDPARYYAVSNQPRDPAAFHIESLPPQLNVGDVRISPGVIEFAVLPHGESVLDLAAGFQSATFEREDQDGDRLGGALKGALQRRGDSIMMRPPARATGETVNDIAQAVATGDMRAEWKVELPAGGSRFTAQIMMHGTALGAGASDGAEFTVEASAAGKTLRHSAYYDCRNFDRAQNLPRDFELDLTPLAGETITLVLCVGAGPRGNATRDDAMWLTPRVEKSFTGPGRVELVAPFPVGAVTGAGEFRREGNRVVFTAPLPGKFTLKGE